MPSWLGGARGPRGGHGGAGGADLWGGAGDGGVGGDDLVVVGDEGLVEPDRLDLLGGPRATSKQRGCLRLRHAAPRVRWRRLGALARGRLSGALPPAGARLPGRRDRSPPTPAGV